MKTFLNICFSRFNFPAMLYVNEYIIFYSCSTEERVRYFRELVRSESESLNASCEYWNEVKQSNESELNEEGCSSCIFM